MSDLSDEQRLMLERAIDIRTGAGWMVKVIRKPPDPLATRVSCGGSATAQAGYCTYRGELLDAIELTRNALAALTALAYDGREPEIAPDAGKMFA